MPPLVWTKMPEQAGTLFFDEIVISLTQAWLLRAAVAASLAGQGA